MIESVQTTTGLIATTMDPSRREAVADTTKEMSQATDRATLSVRAEQRTASSSSGDRVMTRDEADEALAFVRQALTGQDVASVHSGLCAERVMQLVGMAV